MVYNLYYQYGPVFGSNSNYTPILDYHYGTFLPTRGWDVNVQSGILYGNASSTQYYWYHKDFTTLTGTTISEHTLQTWTPSLQDMFVYDTTLSPPNYTTGAVQANWDNRKQFYSDLSVSFAPGSAQWWVNDTDNSWFVICGARLMALEMPSGGYVDRGNMTISSTLCGPLRMGWFPDAASIAAPFMSNTVGTPIQIVSGILPTSKILTRASDLVAIASDHIYWIGSPVDILQKWHSGSNLVAPQNVAVTVTQIGSNFYFDTGGNSNYGLLFNVGTTEPAFVP
jgi:hypothetical protein